MGKLRRTPKLPVGFTLVELLIVAALGSIALGAVATVLVRTIRTSVSIEVNQQALNELGRIASFIELEVGEAAADGAIAAMRSGIPVSCNPSPGIAPLTLTLPNPGGPTRFIQYYTTVTGAETTLWRCGPPIETDGTLNYGSNPTTAFPLGFNLTLTVNTNSLLPRGESVQYTLASTEPGLTRSLSPTVRIRSTRVQ